MLSKITNRSLVREGVSYINGKWVSGAATLAVTNPATGEEIGKIANHGSQETQDAIQAANAALHGSWGQTLGSQRSAILRKWANLMQQHETDLATMLTIEAGKPLAEAKGENTYSKGFIDWYASEADRIHGDVLPQSRPGVRGLVRKQPVGVVGVITPWNFPSAMITRAVGGALAAGCTVVLKPSELTPFSAFALAQLAEEAGVPAGVFNIVGGEATPIGKEICESAVVRKISFTGSTRVGKMLMKQSCDTVKRMAMELGGNAPCIVFEDADIPNAVAGFLASKYRNAGQTCVCTNRLFVQKSIEEKFLSALIPEMQKLKVGNGLDAGVNVGPLINVSGAEKCHRLVESAKAAGATVVLGGEPYSDGRCKTFYPPTLLTGINDKMEIACEEIFGPVTAMQTFETEEEVILKANSVPVGLAAYIFTNDYRRTWRVPEQLQYGMVGVNEGIISTPTAPFGGVKESGLGRDGSKYGIDQFLDIKYVLMGGKI